MALCLHVQSSTVMLLCLGVHTKQQNGILQKAWWLTNSVGLLLSHEKLW